MVPSTANRPPEKSPYLLKNSWFAARILTRYTLYPWPILPWISVEWKPEPFEPVWWAEILVLNEQSSWFLIFCMYLLRLLCYSVGKSLHKSHLTTFFIKGKTILASFPHCGSPIFSISGGNSAAPCRIPNCSHRLLDAGKSSKKYYVGVIYTLREHLQKPNHDAGAK